jgi:glutamate-5-semialdehyde dehydrogenase
MIWSYYKKGHNMLEDMGRKARDAARKLALINAKEKNDALSLVADRLWTCREKILNANKKDVEKGLNSGLNNALIDRLMLDDIRVNNIVQDLRKVISLSDPVGEIFEELSLENGLKVYKIRVPIGVLGVIYESRPNVTVDVSGLALKSGNCVILRGGSETINSNREIISIIQDSLSASAIPDDAVQFVDTADRKAVEEMLKLHQYIDILIPRGSQKLHEYCRENSQIPVMTGGIGICHLYVDEGARLDDSLAVIRNAKIQRPSVCNALDTLLVHRSIAARFIPEVIEELRKDGVKFYVPNQDFSYLRDKDMDVVFLASEDDFKREWLSLVLGIKVVNDLDEAVSHITTHSTGHSDGILTEDLEKADKFVNSIDSAVVYVNASTRFTDGSQLGLGAEVAISTQKLHARGPMALKELTTYKWVVKGKYHVRL